MRRMPLVLAALLFLAVACSSGRPATFAVINASVDPTYRCPGGANNARYDLHATVNVHNGTGSTVTIQAISTEMKLVAVQGPWLERVGDVYDAGDATFSPRSVGPGASTTLQLTISSACTSDRYESGGSSSGGYAVTMHLVTSAGSFAVTAQNRHEIRAA